MALTTIIHCPECGATLKPGEGRCWMCFRPLEWKGNTVRTRDAQQLIYVPAAAGTNRTRTNVGPIIGIVLAVLAMVPTIFIGLFITCLAAIDPTPGSHQHLESTIIVIVSTTVLVLLGLAACIVCLGASVRRR